MQLMQRLFHIVDGREWSSLAAHDTYRPASLDTEGFVHCSFEQQVAGTLALHFPGRTELVVLEIDPALVTAPVVVEDLYGRNEKFPHVYGAIPVGAVVAVHPVDAFVGPTRRADPPQPARP